MTLERFVEAQDPVYRQALTELRRGHKTSHWMWFIFPQLVGLGHSPMAQKYGITGADEARAYLAHPVLGPRLVECTRSVLTHEGRSAAAILGSIDAQKLRSSMTLFAAVATTGTEPFEQALDLFFDGERDGATLRMLGIPQP